MWYTESVSKSPKPFTKIATGSETPERQGKRVPAIFYRMEAGGDSRTRMAEKPVAGGSEAHR